MGLSPKKRQSSIAEIVANDGRVLVEELANRFNTSRETIRRDLSSLASRGVVRKFHGGAELPSLEGESHFNVRMAENAPAKIRIARAMAGLLQPGDTMFIDAGSTTVFLGEELAMAENMTIITNSSLIAESAARGQNRVILIGGEYHGQASECLGEIAIDNIRRFRTKHAILTIGALHREHGVMDFSLGEALVAQAMIAQAESVTLIADGSKLQRSALVRVCGIDEFQRLVTEAPPDAALSETLANHDVDVVIA